MRDRRGHRHLDSLLRLARRSVGVARLGGVRVTYGQAMFDSHTWPVESIPARVSSTRLPGCRMSNPTLDMDIILMCVMKQGDWHRRSVIEEEDS
jgi:hypothetical protein